LKKLLIALIIGSFLIIPFVFSGSAKNVISDLDLDSISAQIGSVTIEFKDIFIKSRQLKYISTDGWNFWDPDHQFPDPHVRNADGFFSTEPQNSAGFEGFTDNGFIGYTDVFVTGGWVRRSGSMTVEVFPSMNPNVRGYELRQTNNNFWYDTGDTFAVDAVIKLGTNQDLSDGQPALGRVYMKGISAMSNGTVTVYAHKTPYVPGATP
jgi:hypothetical protein